MANDGFWEQVEEIFNEALKIPEGTRDCFLEKVEDAAIRQEVKSLLTAGENASEQSIKELIEDAARSALDEPATPQRPSFTPGAEFGRYAIVTSLGHGGMGVVYSAFDNELNRSVALKFLNTERVGLRSAVDRFVREAQAASALNHPNIVTVYEVLRSDSSIAIVMEKVEGKVLREYCSDAQSREQVVHWGQQIAAALAAAHEQGIIHRDIKPENIMVRHDGLVKVLDFGLARHVGSGDHTSTVGVPVGTLRYMSPEQTRGELLTCATDIFSLGIVLYELSTGHHPFASDSPFASAYLIATNEATPPSSVCGSIPTDLETLILAMLAKDQTARPSANAVVQGLVSIRPDIRRPLRSRIGTKKKRWQQFLVLAAGLAGLLLYLRPPAGQVASTVPHVVPFTTSANQQVSPSFSPDGKTVAFAWGSVITHRFSICTKTIMGEEENCTTASGESEYSPAWSPDGRWVAYLRGRYGEPGSIWIRTPSAGDRRKLADIPAGNWPAHRALAWTPDAKALIAEEAGELFLVPLTGRSRRLTAPPEGSSDYSPAISSDGRDLAFTRSTKVSAVLYRMRLDNSDTLQRIPLSFLKWPQNLDACWLPNRRELLVSAGNLGELWRVSLDGASHLLFRSSFGILEPAVSSDGSRAIYVEDRPNINLWTVKLTGTNLTPERADALSSTRMAFDPQYSPDGHSIAFESDRSGYKEIWTGKRDGSGLKQVTNFEGPETGSPYWSPDGKWLTFDSRPEGWGTVFVIPANGGTPRPITKKGEDDVFPSWSHNGKWIYFASSRTGRMEVWRSEVNGSNPTQITRHGGYAPIDSISSQFVYYAKSRNQDDGLWQISLQTREETRILPRELERAFAITPSGLYFGFLVDQFTRTRIEKLPYGTKQPVLVTTMPKPIVLGLSVRPDEGELMLGQLDAHTSQLMLMNLPSQSPQSP